MHRAQDGQRQPHGNQSQPGARPSPPFAYGKPATSQRLSPLRRQQGRGQNCPARASAAGTRNRSNPGTSRWASGNSGVAGPTARISVTITVAANSAVRTRRGRAATPSTARMIPLRPMCATKFST